MSSAPVTDVPVWRLPLMWLRRLYDWVLSWAESKFGALALFLIAFAESSFFPIPPDILLIALSLGKRKKAFIFAAICTAGSVFGAILGWYLGMALFEPVNAIMAMIVKNWHGVMHEGAEVVRIAGAEFYKYADPELASQYGSIFLKVKSAYDENAFMAIFTAAFTPIPFKVFTIAGGYVQVNLGILVLGSIVGRAGRFFLVSGLLYFFGQPVKRFIDKYFDLLAILFTVLLIGGFLIIDKLI